MRDPSQQTLVAFTTFVLVLLFRILSKMIYAIRVCFQYVIVIAVFVVGEAVALGLLYGKPELVSPHYLNITVHRKLHH